MVKRISTSIQIESRLFKLNPMAYWVKALLTGGFFMGAAAPAQATNHAELIAAQQHILPVPVGAAGDVVSSTPTPIGGSGGATFTITQSQGKNGQTDYTMNIVEGSSTVIQWQNFDVGAGDAVNFIQLKPNETATLINQVTPSDSQPSQIDGPVTAPNDIAIVNPNGINVEAGANIDTHGLVLSTLQPTQEAINGITYPGQTQTAGGQANPLSGFANSNQQSANTSSYAAFTANGGSASAGVSGTGYASSGGSGYTGQPQSASASINIQKGAAVTSENGRAIMVFAPNIYNDGKVTATGGQVLMTAATDAVYLFEAPSPPASGATPAPESDVRGLLVQMGTGGSVINDVNGAISANHGNVTLMGFAVNQDGRVSASSTLTENGTIRLVAEQGLSGAANPNFPGNSTPTVNLGPQSVTEILPEVQYNANGKETTAPANQAVPQSRLEIVASTVNICNAADAACKIAEPAGSTGLNGIYAPPPAAASAAAQINAPSGKIDIITSETLSNIAANDTFQNSYAPDASAINVDGGAGISVAGLETSASMASNVIPVKLQSTELANSPFQKNGILYGQTVLIDMRADGGLGSPLANISPETAVVPLTLEEKLANGGMINFTSEGGVSVLNNAQLNYAGGQIDYQSGYVDTTKLITSTGQVVDIGNANPLQTYVAIYGQYSTTDAKWGVTQNFASNGGMGSGTYEQGYVQGGSAGAFNISANNVVMDGTLDAHATSGQLQRALNSASLGGSLNINDMLQNAVQNVVFSNQTPPGGDADLTLNTGMLAKSGLQNIKVQTNGDITITAGSTLQLAPLAALSLQGGDIHVDGNIQGSGASVTLKSVFNENVSSAFGNITVGGDSAASNIDLRGGWINDVTDPGNLTANNSSLSIDGGSFNADAQGNLTVAPHSVIDVSGGAWLQSNRTVTAGVGGDITLIAANPNAAGNNLSIKGAVLNGYGLKQGGSLTLEANQVEIGGAAQTSSGALQPLQLADSFFSNGGFASYSVTSDVNGLTVAQNAAIKLQQANTQLSGDYLGAGNAANIGAVSTVTTLPPELRAASSLTLDALHYLGLNNSELTVGAGASITADPLSTVTLKSDSSINMQGTITDPGGNVALNISVPKPLPNSANNVLDPFYQNTQGIWLGAKAVIDTSGAVMMEPNSRGFLMGSVYDGGNVSLIAERGFIATQNGSLINVSGTQASLFMPTVTALGTMGYAQQTVGSNGGSVTFQAAEGVYLEGNMSASAGNAPGVSGGSLSITLDNTQTGANSVNSDGFPDTPRSIVVSENPTTVFDNFVAEGPGAALASNLSFYANAYISAKQINNAGFDTLNLAASSFTPATGTNVGEILFQDNVTLKLADAISLDASQLGWQALSGNIGTVNLDAPMVALGETNINLNLLNGAPAPVSGGGTLNVNADGQSAGMIILQGVASTSGYGAVNLHAGQDISLRGELNKAYNQGGLDGYQGLFETATQLNLSADRVYPTTLSQFSLIAGANAVNQPAVEALASSAAAGAKTLDMQSVTGLAVGDNVTGSGVAANTTITAISGNSVTLSSPLSGAIGSGAQISADYPSETVATAASAGSTSLAVQSVAGLAVGDVINGAGLAANTVITNITPNAGGGYTVALNAATVAGINAGAGFAVSDRNAALAAPVIAGADTLAMQNVTGWAVGDVVGGVGIALDTIITAITANAAGGYTVALSAPVTAAINKGGELYASDYSSVSFNANNSRAPEPVLEADAKLTVQASVINQNGNILAPFGQIDLQAANQINFGANSLTSVSGQNQIIPFGVTSAGLDWLYPVYGQVDISQNNNPLNLIVGGSQATLAMPEKQITLNAPGVSTAGKAAIDLAGGGDLMAYEFVPVTGDPASKDVLAPGNAVGGGVSFAVLPGYTGYAPYDPFQSLSSGLTVGEQVTLGAGSGLAAGTYTLLPSHYALLPGAYLVTMEPGAAATPGLGSVIAPGSASASEPAGLTSQQLSGEPLVSGYFSTLGVNGNYSVAGVNQASGALMKTQGSSEFLVEPGSVPQTYSQYTISYGDSFFAKQAATDGIATPQLAQDAGQLAATVNSMLELPTLQTQGVNSAEVDISANNIKVVNATDGANGVVELLASDLNADNIGTLFLGGSRSTDSSTGNTLLNVNATSVAIAPGVTLNNAEAYILAGSGQSNGVVTGPGVEVGAGAALTTNGSLAAGGGQMLETTGDSGILRVAAGPQVTLERSNSPGFSGDIQLDQNVGLTAANGSILVASTGSNSSLGNTAFNVGANGALALYGANINLGATDKANPAGLSLDTNMLAGLHIAQLLLNSGDGVNLYGAIDTPAFNSLVLNSDGLKAFDSAGITATINATNLTLSNPSGAAASNASSSAGVLDIKTDNLTLATTGGGQYSISGYNAVNITAAKTITGENQGIYNILADTVVTAPVISGASNANTTLNAAGHALTVNNEAGANAAAGVNASLNLTADSLTVNTSLIYQGGNVNLTALNGDLNLGADADIDVSATHVTAGLNPQVQIPAGRINLTSAQSVYTDTASQMKLNSSVAGVAAGALTVNAQHAALIKPIVDTSALSTPFVDLNGVITASGPGGKAAPDPDGGRLQVYVNNLDASNSADNVFTDLKTLAAEAGFTGQFGLRAANGDITVDTGQTVAAQTINLEADNGAITVNGELNASSANGGAITLSSADLANGAKVTVSGTLDAHATENPSNTNDIGVGGNGGTVIISAVNQAAAINAGQTLQPAQYGAITLYKGSSIDVHGQGDYSQANCVTLGMCGSLGQVLLEVDRQAVNNGAASVGNVALNGSIDIAPVNTGSGSAGIDANNPRLYPEIVAVRVYDQTSSGAIAAADISNFQNDASAFMAALPTAPTNYVVEPGIEVVTTGGAALNLNAPWDLSAQRYTYNVVGGSGGSIALNAPGQLLLRSSGELNINGNLTDGFQSHQFGKKPVVTVNELLTDTYSWSYTLVAGADLSAASPTVIDPANNAGGAGDLSISANTSLYTGSGDITLNAAGNIDLTDSSEIYTAGLLPAGMLTALQSAYNKSVGFVQYPVAGGDISLTAGANINVAVNQGDKMGFPTDWLTRSQAGNSVAWGVNFAKFDENLGALAGGNITVSAGGNISDLTAAIPTTGYAASGAASPTVNGGGDLNVTAGGDIAGGAFYVEYGQANITAGGSLTAGAYNNSSSLFPILAVGNAQMSVMAGQNLNLETILNPMILSSTIPGSTQFFTYDYNPANSAGAAKNSTAGVVLTALSGDVNILYNSNSNDLLNNTTIADNNPADLGTFPGALTVNALQGSLNLNTINLFPSPTGNLSLYAYDNIVSQQANTSIVVSSANPASLPSVATGSTLISNIANILGPSNYAQPDAYSQSPLHAGDSNPVLISTGVGAIGNSNLLAFYLPKQAIVNAATDITNTSFWIQQNAATDNSLISAGQNITFPITLDPYTAVSYGIGSIQVSGPGQLTVVSGANINLGASDGIIS
ncbi:MAG: filamentous hemagglutinin N-terminal domain-containing protein, partial [Methylomonas sp.]